MKLSIVIPYYNTWEYTKKLLDVLKTQITKDVEVIIIDDGCNEFRLEDFTFATVIHLNKNYGASHAWNVGLEYATGEYIGFIDSDDIVTPNYIDTLLYAIEKENTDEIIFGFWRNNSFNVATKIPYCRAIWKAIYKKWLVPKFDETLKYGTDGPFSKHLRITPHSKSFIKIPLYIYTTNREGSITWKRLHKLFKEEI